MADEPWIKRPLTFLIYRYLFRNLTSVLIFGLILFVAITLISYLLFQRLGLALNLNDDIYYWTLSSIFQGLFSILAFTGIYIVFKIEQLNRDIDKFDGDIRMNLPKLKPYFDDATTRCSYNQIEHYLDKRFIIKFINCLLEARDKIGEEESDEDIGRYNICFSRIHLINDRIHIRDSIKKELMLPFVHGIMVIALSILLLPALNPVQNPFPFLIPRDMVIGIMVGMTVVVIIEIFAVMYHAAWGRWSQPTA